MDAALKIQALWRGYRSRKGQVLPCCSCGYEMTLKKPEYPETMSAQFFSNQPCSWCQEKEKPCDCYECTEPELERCYYCGKEDCREECREEETYIPCCICGANCDGSDYESWRVCSRRCLVEPDRRER